LRASTALLRFPMKTIAIKKAVPAPKPLHIVTARPRGGQELTADRLKTRENRPYQNYRLGPR
ncbi:hypothetical protein, partial [Beijerinckia sp. L45]|uniref:hypothetical protein n=1 Tax=Beijerinckia sp. L45 TaxID=1641855 RepID=UPI001AEEF5B7